MTSGSPDTTLQHLKSPAGHCSKVCFHLGCEANLMCFKVTLHLFGRVTVHGKHVDFSEKKQQTFLRSQTWNDLALWNARIHHGWENKEATQNSSKDSTSSEATTKHLNISFETQQVDRYAYRSKQPLMQPRYPRTRQLQTTKNSKSSPKKAPPLRVENPLLEILFHS